MIYQMESDESPGLKLLSAFADDGQDGPRQHLQIGEGLIGQCAVEKRRMQITDLPVHAAPIRSGLFQAVPRNVIVLPVLFEDQIKAVIELASLRAFTASHLAFLEQLTVSIGIVLNSIEATMQTEGLLKQSQQLAAELQTQQKELQQTNEQLAQKAQQLAEQNVGEIQLRSTPGSGSTFTLYLPQTYVGPSLSGVMMTDGEAAPAPQSSTFPVVRVSERPLKSISDDRDSLQPDDAVLLIVEDDPHYARVLSNLSRDKGFKVIVAMHGADALDLARQYRPTAVSLDVFLPDMLGWTVLSHLKQDPATRHIPVQIVSLDEDRQHGLARGASSFVTKLTTTEGLEAALSRIREYATPRRKRLLVVEDNAAEQLSITELLGHDDIDIAVADTGRKVLAALREQPFDCVVLNLRLPDMSGSRS